MHYSYKEVIDKIQNCRRFGNHTGYEVSKSLLQQLGNPQSGIPFVHIAGTNGKGSTTAFLSSIMQQTGKRVGMFTSPHLISFRERIRVNGEYISEEAVERLGNQLLHLEYALSPTMFDYCLAMAVLYFKEQGCDLMVMETGIGGRYDSTNALGVPEVAVITKIGLDHTVVLGDTIEAIAQEKAGIIKTGCPVVVSMQEPSVTEMLLKNFKEVNSEEKVPAWYQVTDVDFAYAKGLKMQLQGKYQWENAATAILAAKELGASEEAIREGIAKASWKGRMELVNENPFFLIDGAHNSNGVHALAESLRGLYPGEKFHFIMGVMADKDYEEMIEELLPLAIDFVTVTPESERALQSEDLAKCIQEKGIPASYTKDMKEAILPYLPNSENRQNAKPKNGKTIGFGSLYFIGEIEAMLEENKRN